MTEDEQDRGDFFKIEDEEGFVDKKQKQAILDLRNKVDDREDELMFAAGDDRINETQAVGLYHRTINQFLRRIEPLLRSDEINGATQAYYYEPLGDVEIPPPPVEFDTPQRYLEREAIELKDRFDQADADPQYVLAQRSNIPTPKEKTVKGLKTVIERDGVSAEWEVGVTKINDEELATFDRGEQITISNTVPFGWGILTNAVRIADSFLDNADLGLSAVNEQEGTMKDKYKEIMGGVE